MPTNVNSVDCTTSDTQGGRTESGSKGEFVSTLEEIWDQVSDDELWPPPMRDVYVKELIRMGDSPGMAQFRLRQRMSGLRERWAKEHCVCGVNVRTMLPSGSFLNFVKELLR